ncbi:hypothetical protein NQ318_019428, partial [Aromia moschata]
AEVVRLFREKYPELPPISQGTGSKIEKQFRERGHVRQLKKSPPNKLSDDQKLNVMLMLEENPHTSSRQTASALNNSHSSILHVLTENQMHPYKLAPTNELAEVDFDRRILFCEQKMLFLDESTFTLHGRVNRQNCRYWSRKSPHWMRELHTQNPGKALLQNNGPMMANLYPAEGNPQLPGNAMWFQQDGAPAHYDVQQYLTMSSNTSIPNNVQQYIHTIFPNRCIGRRGFVEWPARSPDLTALDFFLCKKYGLQNQTRRFS